MNTLKAVLTMLLPTKGINPERALLVVGADLLHLLDSPATISGLWERFTHHMDVNQNPNNITFDWFSLSLSMLFTINAIKWNENNRLVKCNVSS